MAITIYENKDMKSRERVTPGRRLYLDTTRTKIVEDGDPEARYLFCTEKQSVLKDDLDRMLQKPKTVETPPVEVPDGPENEEIIKDKAVPKRKKRRKKWPSP